MSSSVGTVAISNNERSRPMPPRSRRTAKRRVRSRQASEIFLSAFAPAQREMQAPQLLVALFALTNSSLLMPAVTITSAAILDVGCAQSRAS